jgi:hypothetical protein
MSTKVIDEIVTEFHSTIFKTLKICQKIEPNNLDLEWLRKQVSLARDMDPLLIINACSDKVWEHREYIITENEDFFLNNEYDEYIKDAENKSFMYELVNLIKKKYRAISDAERRALWTLVKAMLASVAKYKKAIGDFV